MSSVWRRAFGKVNLCLRVIGKRRDGYHEISTVMVAVSLSDVLAFSRSGDGVSVTCPGLCDLPQERNLVTRAVRALLGGFEERTGVTVEIEKNIPPGAGMGGGSSDAAAALLVVNDMLPRHRRQSMIALTRIASSLGADIPFFLGCNSIPAAWGAALCTGIGDLVRPLEFPALTGRPLWLVLAFPRLRVNTAQAYRDWDEMGVPGSGEETEAAVLSALESGDWQVLARSLRNDLEAPVFARYPSLRAVKRRLMECGALGACMTGSGSGVLGVCGSERQACEVKVGMDALAKDLGLGSVVVVRTGCEA